MAKILQKGEIKLNNFKNFLEKEEKFKILVGGCRPYSYDLNLYKISFLEKWGDNVNKEKLKEKFKYAKENDLGIAIEVTVPTRQDSEIIITKNSNLDYKLDYYLNNYNDNLELETCKDVKILSIKTISGNEL